MSIVTDYRFKFKFKKSPKTTLNHPTLRFIIDSLSNSCPATHYLIKVEISREGGIISPKVNPVRIGLIRSPQETSANSAVAESKLV
jgi:hypothetical protein